MNHLLNPKQLSAFLNVPLSFIYDRTRNSALDPIPHYKIGKYLRFDLEQVQAWIAEHGR